MSHSEVLAFVAEWYDPQPQMIRKFLIKVFTETNSIEIIDLKSRKSFLKHSPLPEPATISDFILGGKVLIHARLMTLVEYGDEYTRRKLSARSNTDVIFVSPDAYHNMGAILQEFVSRGLTISKLQTIQLSETDSFELIDVLGLTTPLEQTARFLQSGPAVAVELKGEQVRDDLTNIVAAIRSKYATSDVEAAVWTAPTLSDFLFGTRSLRTTATLDRCTCAVIKPHAIKSGDFAKIIAEIQSSAFTITAAQMFELNETSAREFLEIYEGVLPHFQEYVREFCTGPCIALEIRSDHDDVVSKFREFLGPWDVEMAKELRPASIRARFGQSRPLNAVHCTDLPDDGINEVGYFFELLQGS